MAEDTLEATTSEVESWKNVIAELCAQAPDTIVRDCLRLYDPEKDSNTLRKIFKKCLKDSLLLTLQFLGRTVPDNTKKDELIDLLLLRVKNFFPEICLICNEEYAVKLDDPCLLSCDSCGQEVHRCCYLQKFSELKLLKEDGTLDRNILFVIPGLHFLCGNCEEGLDNLATESDSEFTDKEVVPKDEQEDNINKEDDDDDEFFESSSTISDECNSDITVKHTEDDQFTQHIIPNVIIASEESHKSSKNLGRTEFLKNHGKREAQKNIPLTSIPIDIIDTQDEIQIYDDVSQKSKQICKFFKKQSCKHGPSGKNCKYTHPKLCKKFVSHGTRKPNGCSLGKKCKFFHPQMCFESLRKGCCFRQDCKFRHVKGTKREPEKKPQQEQYTNQMTNHLVNVIPDIEPKPSDQNPFLDLIRQLKAEIIHQMDMKLQPVHQEIAKFYQLQQNLPVPVQHQFQNQLLTPHQQHFRMPLSHQIH